MITVSYKIQGMGMPTTPRTFGEWLKSARTSRGLNATDLAAAAGITQPAIAAYEAGTRNPKRVTVIALAQALKVSESEALVAAGFASMEIERIVSDEEWELVQAFRGLDGPIKRNFKGFLLSAVEVTGDEPKEELVYGRGPIKGQKPLE